MNFLLKRYRVLKTSSMLCYLCILFKGMVIPIPLGLCLLGWVFDFSNRLQQLCALGGLAGIVGMVIALKMQDRPKRLIIDLIGLMLLLLPIIARMTAIPISLFNYGAFYIPAICFLVLFLFSLFFAIRATPMPMSDMKNRPSRT